MSLQQLIKPFFWHRYSKKVQLRIDSPYCVGTFTQEDAEERGFHLAFAQEGSVQEGNCIALYWLVDKQDGVIVDARFQVFGNSVLIAIAEVSCELAVGKNYDQVSRMHADFIDGYLRGKNEETAFPEETYMHVNLAVDAIEAAAKTCEGIPLAESYVAPPITEHEIEVVEGGYPGWQTLSLKQKLAVIEEVIAKDVRPYIELDAGGIEVLNLINDKEVIIAYQGACTTCHSATGATLSYIQHVLRAKVHPDLMVIPNL